MKCTCGAEAVFTGFRPNDSGLEDREILVRAVWICEATRMMVRECRLKTKISEACYTGFCANCLGCQGCFCHQNFWKNMRDLAKILWKSVKSGLFRG